MSRTKPKKQAACLIVMMAIWAVWAKSGAPILVGAIEAGARPGMAMLDQPDPETAFGQLQEHSDRAAGIQKQTARELRDGLTQTTPAGAPATGPTKKLPG